VGKRGPTMRKRAFACKKTKANPNTKLKERQREKPHRKLDSRQGVGTKVWWERGRGTSGEGFKTERDPKARKGIRNCRWRTI